MKVGNKLNPIIREVQKQYVRYRKKGLSREAAIEEIRAEYSQEMCDEDDKPAVLIGVLLALCKKKELFFEFAEETLEEIQRRYGENKDGTDYSKIQKYLEDEEMYGEEAFYKKTSVYAPEWKIGDVFSHVLTYPMAKMLGIEGWLILLVKVGEYTDEFDAQNQLVCISLCPPEKIPTSSKDLGELGYIPVMNTINEEYLAQITIKSKKAEKDYQLSKIGYFPDVLVPQSCLEENPFTAMPLIGKREKGQEWLVYEEQICRFYKWYGMKK